MFLFIGSRNIDAEFRVDDVDTFNWSRSEIAYSFYCRFESCPDYKKRRLAEVTTRIEASITR